LKHKLTTKALIIGLGIIAICSTILVSADHQLACEGQPVNDNLPITAAQQIFGERLIGQSFISPVDNLNRIDLFLQTYDRRNTEDVLLRLLEIPKEVVNPLEGTEVFQTSFNASTVKDKTWHSFYLPQPIHSTGKTYLIALQSPNSQDGNAITIGGIQQNVYTSGDAFIYAPDLAFPQLTPIPGDMMFRVCYDLAFNEKMEVLLNELGANRPALWGSRGFYLTVVGIYFVLVFGFLWRLGLTYDTKSDTAK